MGLPLRQTVLDAEAYLAWEATQANKSEYVAGEVFAMVGVRRVHATVAGNIFAALREHLRGTPCMPYISDMKLRIEAADAFFYPDVMVTCDARDRLADLYVEHPQLIVEILSDSTAAYDRGAKFAAYRQIAALQEFVLIDIDARRIEMFRRQTGKEWLLHDYAGEPGCHFASVNLTLAMETVFEDVEPSIAA
ncbi:MAG: Uma2 family endonuclease [Rhodoferax sp.]|nr:Uma2 family endonuclease [Rhodoferax sp.]